MAMVAVAAGAPAAVTKDRRDIVMRERPQGRSRRARPDSLDHIGVRGLTATSSTGCRPVMRVAFGFGDSAFQRLQENPRN